MYILQLASLEGATRNLQLATRNSQITQTHRNNSFFILNTTVEEGEIRRLWIFFWDEPFLSRFCEVGNTHNETFVINFCLQLLCVSYSAVQTMKLLYATSPYLLLFPSKIMQICIKSLSTWCLTGGQNCCPIVSDCHCTCNATFKWPANNKKLLDKKMDSTKKCIWGSPCFVRRTSKWGPKELEKLS